MNNNTIEDLVKLGIYSSKTISEEQYNKCLKNNNNDSLIYITGRHESGNSNYNKYYKEINTKGMTTDDVKLQLEINRTKNISSIKNMVMFFVIVTVIVMVLAGLYGISIIDTLSNARY